MKRILVIQFRRRPEMIEREQAEYQNSVGDRASLEFISALDTALDWSRPESIVGTFDGVILGGSGEFDLDGGREHMDPSRLTAREAVERLRPFVAHMLEKNIPVLGVCLGHQLIAEIGGGNVTHDHSQKKVGTYEVAVTEEGKQDVLFSALPASFMAQYGHKDSVTSLPAGSTVLASGATCRYSALRYGQKAYTVQFHPELTEDDIEWKFQNSPGYVPEGGSIKGLIKPSPEASRLIGLWVESLVSGL